MTLVDPVGGDRVFDGVLAGEELIGALDLVRNGAGGAGIRGFGPLLASTVFEHVFAGAPAIALDSPQGATLLAWCKDASPNPFALEAWFAEITPATVATSD